MEIILTTGKKVNLREKKGQHHFVERKLLAACLSDGGQNIGGILSTVTIQAVVCISAVDGTEVKIPTTLADVFEVMNHFTYEEWNEFETSSLPKGVKEKLEEAAKNSHASSGLDTV